MSAARRREAYTNPLSLSSQFSFCGLPVRLDSYTGCAFRCTYCFARYRGGNTYGEAVRPASSRALHVAFERAAAGGGGVLGQFLRRRVPIHFGGMSDPFQPAEVRHKVTLAMLTTLASWNYPVVISTRGPLVAQPAYTGLLTSGMPVVVQFSFATTRDDVAAGLEPTAPRPSELLRAMERLSRAGVPVTCRWQPFITGVSEDPREFGGRVARAGARHVALEHLKIPVERRNPLWAAFLRGAGFDAFTAYRARGGYRDGREFVLPAVEKLGTALAARSAVHEHGMTFGAADNELQFLSDTACCCSGVDQVPGFERWFRFQIAHAVRKCRGRSITFAAIADEWRPSGSIDRYLNSRSRLAVQTGGRGWVDDHVRVRWEDPWRAGSPASFYGVIPTKQRDRHGQRVYTWRPEVARLMVGVPASGAARERS